MSNAILLKPCPFCGDVMNLRTLNCGDEFSVSCRQCGITGAWRDTAEDAIAAWNRRPGEDALREQRDELAQAMVKMGTIAPHNVCVFCVQFAPSHKPDCPVLKAAAYLKEAT